MKTKEEIKALIATAIAEQGNQVDSGGKLAEILDEIVEMANRGGFLVIEDVNRIISEQEFDKIKGCPGLIYDNTSYPPMSVDLASYASNIEEISDRLGLTEISIEYAFGWQILEGGSIQNANIIFMGNGVQDHQAVFWIGQAAI